MEERIIETADVVQSVDVAIIGAGPAGLACALRLKRLGCNILVVDAGCTASERDRNNEVGAILGVGGAGLFSDGKFSWYPSATALWKLRPGELRDAEEWVREVLTNIGIVDIPQLPDLSESHVDNNQGENDGKWHLKHYPTWYASLPERMTLIEQMHRDVGANRFLLETAVVLSGSPGAWLLREQVTGRVVTQAKQVVVASGRFWHLTVPDHNLLHQSFQRIEFGVRIETDLTNPFFTKTTQGIIDPKFVMRLGAGVEFRTFCCIKDGEVVNTAFCGIRTCSGRADGNRSGKANIGFNCRVKDAVVANKILAEGFFENMSECTFNVFFSERSEALRRVYGPTAADIFEKGLAALTKEHPELKDSVLRGPTLEGVGNYPTVSSSLQTPQGVYVVGDATGLFRGIVAALVSGHYVATLISNAGVAEQ